jgi:hypothetical protein
MTKMMLGVCLLAAASVQNVAANNAASAPSGKAIEREMRDLRADKLALSAEAGTLGSLARVHHLTAWESHSIQLGNVRDIVNRSGARLAKLEAANEALTQRQREALRTVKEQLAPVAAQTSTLMRKLKEDQRFIRFPEYFNEVQKLVAAAERTAQTADRAIEVAFSGQPVGPTGD